MIGARARASIIRLRLRLRQVCLSLLLVIAPTVAFAQNAPVGAPVRAPELLGSGYLLQVFGSLLVVFLCLFAVLYGMRRLNRIGGPGSVPLRVLGTASVGAREKVVLMEAGGKQLLIGVSPGSVRTLHCFDEPLVGTPDSTGSGVSFAQVLRSATGKGGPSS